MLSYVMILFVAFFGTTSTFEICPVSVDAETSEIKINATAFTNFGRRCESGNGSREQPGPIRLVGPRGEKGEPGAAGKPEYHGPEGPKGSKGEAGPKGEEGNVGQQGNPGADVQFPWSYEKRMRDLEEAVVYLGKSWRTIGQYRIWFSDFSVNYQEAEKLCKSIRGRLAAKSIRDSNVRGVIYEITKEKHADFLIGLDDIHREGNFVWSDGVTFTKMYKHLWLGQPDNYKGKEDCVAATNRDSKLRLYDTSCAYTRRVICEQDV